MTSCEYGSEMVVRLPFECTSSFLYAIQAYGMVQWYIYFQGTTGMSLLNLTRIHERVKVPTITDSFPSLLPHRGSLIRDS